MAKKDTVLSVAQEIRDMMKETKKNSVKTVVVAKEDARFVKNTDDSVLDTQTGLIWGPTLSKQMSWADALKACKDFDLGGHKDWRLPTVNELFSLVDRKRYNPAIDKDFFPDTKSSWYWTCEKRADDADYAWIVGFGGGYVFGDYKVGEYYVRPCRSSQ